MQIISPCTVALTWKIKDTLGTSLHELQTPTEFFVGSGYDLFTKIEQELQGHKADDVIQLHLEPNEAFGDFNEQLIFLESRSLFHASLYEGMLIEGRHLPDGINPNVTRNCLYAITDIYPEHIVLDGNHPLAGIALRLTINIHSVRPASSQEIQQNSAGENILQLQIAKIK